MQEVRLEGNIDMKSHEYNNLMRSKCLYSVLSHFKLFYHGKNLISSIFIHYCRNRFQDGVHKVLFNSISLCVTTLTDPLTWTTGA